MCVLALASIGGLVSAFSTGAGSLMAPIFSRFEKLRKIHMSMDFALGVMLSAVAFSLVGPELMKGQSTGLVVLGLICGSLFIWLTHNVISFFNRNSKGNSYKILLISALIFHNLPEGMGAGASLAGMNLHEAIPLQVALSVQNIAEGLLLTLLLRSMGLTLFHSVLGGILSGFVEMSGAVAAGLVMDQTVSYLPFFLALAGGAMMMSVGMEMYESLSQGKKIDSAQFIAGLLVIPFTNLLSF